MKLNTEPNIARPDDFYEALIDLHRGLTDEQSRQLNARLILLLANHIGDMEVLAQAMKAAAENRRDRIDRGDSRGFQLHERSSGLTLRQAQNEDFSL